MGKGPVPCPECPKPHHCALRPSTAINLEGTRRVLAGMEPSPSTSKSEKPRLTLIFHPPHTGYLENSDSCTDYGPV